MKKIIAVWQTKSSRRQQILGKWCKDYGLTLLRKNLYAGMLTEKERLEIGDKFSCLLTRKNEWYYLLSAVDLPQDGAKNIETHNSDYVIIRD